MQNETVAVPARPPYHEGVKYRVHDSRVLWSALRAVFVGDVDGRGFSVFLILYLLQPSLALII